MNISLHAPNLHLCIFFVADSLLLLGRFIASFVSILNVLTSLPLYVCLTPPSPLHLLC